MTNYQKNKEKYKARAVRWREDNPERWNEINKRSTLKRRYGITLEEYNRMFEYQNGKCGICGISRGEVKRDFSVDHNHEVGFVRGLLCENCNHALGKAREDVIVLERMITYIQSLGYNERTECLRKAQPSSYQL